MKYMVAWDYLGISASAACVVHCVFTPFMLLVLPVYAALLPYDELVHQLLAAVVVPVALLAIVPGFFRHRRHRVPIWILAGMGLIVFAAFGGGDALGGWWEEGFTLAGSAMLVCGHWLNRSFCRVCPVCNEDANPVSTS